MSTPSTYAFAKPAAKATAGAVPGRITVLVGQRPHPVSGRWVKVPGDAIALALALQLAGPGGVRLLSAGALDAQVARDYLALGARQIEILELPVGSNPVPALLEALQQLPLSGRDLVFTGLRGEQSLGSGALPYALARQLGCAVLRDVLALEDEGDAWRLTQALPKGARRHWRLNRPAVLAIHPSAAPASRHALAAVLQGQVLRLTGASSSRETEGWQPAPAAKRLVPLEAARAQSGHSRMLSAVGGEGGATKAQVLSEGSVQHKAQALLGYLQAHGLLPF